VTPRHTYTRTPIEIEGHVRTMHSLNLTTFNLVVVTISAALTIMGTGLVWSGYLARTLVVAPEVSMQIKQHEQGQQQQALDHLRYEITLAREVEVKSLESEIKESSAQFDTLLTEVQYIRTRIDQIADRQGRR
jgi:hypothetical protein